MKTTVELPDTLVNEAMQIAHTTDKQELLTVALKELVRKKRIQKIKSFKNSVDLDIDLNLLREQQ